MIGGVSIDTVVGAGATITIAVLGAVAYWATQIARGQSSGKMASDAAGVAKAASDVAAASAKDAHARLDQMSTEFGNFKEKVAREYVPNAALLALESRMAAEFSKVSDKLDRLFRPVSDGSHS